MLAGGFVAGVGGGAGEGGVDAVEERLARRVAVVERAGLHEMLEHALVDRAAVDAADEVLEVGERAVGLALLNDLRGGEFADALDAGEAEANGASGAIRFGS